MAKKKSVEEKPKKRTDGPPSRDDRVSEVLEFTAKKMKGRAVIGRASEFNLPYMYKRFPTGLLTLDVILRGGFPAGGISQIAGPKNSGKSYLAWQVFRQQQFYKGQKFRGLLAMTEMLADRGQARAAGVRISMGLDTIKEIERGRVASGLPPYTKEEIAELMDETGEIHELHGMSAEDLYDVVLKAVEKNAYHVIVIDSIGMVISGAEAEAESMSDKTYGGAAGVNTQFLRKLSGLLCMKDEYGQTRDVCILGINQIRDAIGDPTRELKSPGGRALDHAKFVDLFTSSGAPVKKEIPTYTANGTKNQVHWFGKEVNWRIEKGKAGMHEGQRGSYIYMFEHNNADFYTDTIVAGVQAGVIETAGAWLGIRDPENPEQYLFRHNGKEAFARALYEDAQQKAEAGETDTMMNRIRELVFKHHGIYIDYTVD